MPTVRPRNGAPIRCSSSGCDGGHHWLERTCLAALLAPVAVLLAGSLRDVTAADTGSAVLAIPPLNALTEDASPPTWMVSGLIVLSVVAAAATVILLYHLMRSSRTVRDQRSRIVVVQSSEDMRIDRLTGLNNRRAFQEEVHAAAAALKDHTGGFCVVLLDLDDLALVNDRQSMSAGDETIESMALTMREMARWSDRLFRVGGDEFAMLLPDTSLATAVALTERLLEEARAPDSGARPSPFSAGVSALPEFGRDPEVAIRQAQVALDWVKRHGRGSVEVFEPERDRVSIGPADATRNAVQEVVSGRLLVPVFQPIVDLRTGRVLGFEGLIRPDPKGPLPDATRLFAAAAASGRTVELDVACIEQVLGAARAIGPDRLLTLNLSPRTLEVRDFDAGWLLQGLYRNGISPSRVIVELTERDEIHDLVHLRQTFQHLRQYGLRLAADDVGAGNAGLRLLSQVQFDIVKLDLTLVHDGVRRMGARAVLQSLRDLALDQHAHVVAEGVETPEQLQVLRDLHIGAGQGFLLGRPAASVAATFVDVDHLGEEDLGPALIPLAALTSGQLVSRAGQAAHGVELTGYGLRSTVPAGLRRDRLLGSPVGTA